MMRTGYGSPGGNTPGMMPGQSAGTSGASGGLYGSDGGSGGEGGAGLGYQRGGPVRRLRRPARLLRRPVVVRRRRGRVGYADGGEVNPLLVSVGLDARSNNPAHYDEDREALSTRPAGAPQAPEEYEEGGEVAPDDTEDPLFLPDYQEPPETPEPPEEAESDPNAELDRQERADAEAFREANQQDQQEQQRDQAPPEREPPEGEPPADRGGQAPPGEEGQAPPEEEGGGGAAGGGAGGGQPEQSKTGYGEQAEQGQKQPAPDTGYNQAQAPPEQNALKEVLDWTRKAMGITEAKADAPPAAGAPDPSEQTTAPNQLQAASAATAQTAAPSGQGGSTPDQSAETPAPPPQAQQAAVPESPDKVPTAPKETAMRTPAPAASGPGNKQAIQEYVSGKGAYSPEQMTELLDRTNQGNPNLGQNGAIREAFKGLVEKGDMDGASKFVQALRPSYDNVRALLIAATAKGDFAAAMQIAEKMNNLIPNGQSARFGQTPDGQIVAMIQPDDGGPATTFKLTPEQFSRYANGSLSLFDHTAEQGLNTNFTLLTGQPGQTGPAGPGVGGTQLAMATPTGGTATDAPTGYATQKTPAAPSTTVAAATAPPATAPPATAPPAPTAPAPAPAARPARTVGDLTTGYMHPPGGGYVSPETNANAKETAAITRDASLAALAQRQQQQQTGYREGQVPGQQGGRFGSLTEMEKYNIAKEAYDKFPMSNQDTQRGNYAKYLTGQALRDISRREGNQYRETPANRMDREQFKQQSTTERETLKQQHLDARADQASNDKNFQIQTSRDNAWLRAQQAHMTSALKDAVTEMIARRKSYETSPYYDPKKPFVPTEQDKDIMAEIYKGAVQHGLDLTQSRTPPLGGQQPAAAPAAPTAPAATAATAPAPAPAPAPAAPRPPISGANGATPPAPATAPATPTLKAGTAKTIGDKKYIFDGKGWLVQ